MSLRVLMYHSVSTDGTRDDLTVTAGQLEAQFALLRSKGYTTLSLSELLTLHALRAPLPPRAVLVTFDDGFLDNYTVAYPLARRYGIKINLFIVPAFLSDGAYRGLLCLGENHLRSMDPGLVEFGLHSFAHESYGDMDMMEMMHDIVHAQGFMEVMGVPYQPCVAYPFGAYPTDFRGLCALGIQMAFRIGNRVNRWPLREPYLVQRMDVRGTDPPWVFGASLGVGRKWLPG